MTTLHGRRLTWRLTVSKELELTDEQYLRVLKKIGATLAQSDFKVGCSDCVVPGQRSTDSNCGFCNDAYTDEDMALFPAQFPARKSMKYRQENHRCPFDVRDNPGILGWGWSCFSECYLFRHLGKRDWDVSLMRRMVDHAIGVAV